MPTEVESTHNLYIVKWNNGDTLRLVRFFDVLGDVDPEERLEIEVRDLDITEGQNPMWQKHKIIWFSPAEDFWVEATQEDDKARAEYQSALDNLHKFPDITPGMDGSYGTLLILHKSEKGFTVVDGIQRNTKPN